MQKMREKTQANAAEAAAKLNFGFPKTILPKLPSGALGESKAQKAEFSEFGGLIEEPMKREPLPPQNKASAARLNFGFPTRLPDEAVHGST